MAALLGALAHTVAAAEVLVVIPDVREPYRSVLIQMVDGVKTITSVRLVQIAGDDATNSEPDWGAGEERAVIVLGSAATSLAMQQAGRLPIVAGAIITPAEKSPLPGISLEPDPGKLFDQLIHLRPGIRTVHWLYRPERSGWLLERVQAAGRERQLQLVAVATVDARSAAHHYQEILAHADSATEAIWLSQDPAILGADSTLLDILEKAWTKNIIVFSGSTQHVARGALFALFPDNVAMGADLAKMALEYTKGASVKFEPNRSLRRAVNRRTAEHLRITMEAGDHDLVLPAR